MLTAYSGRTALAFVAVACISACGGGGGGSPQPPAPTFAIGGTVSGLAGSGLVLQNNGGANLTVGGNGPFAFGAQLAGNAAYNVTVLTQPTAPSQTCVVANGAGSVGNANVSNIAVSCTTNSFAVGGAVSGLAGSGLVLINNGGEDRAIAADGAFTFRTSVLSGATYDVRVLTQPRDPVQRCTIANASGVVGAAAVSAMVSCVTQHPRYAYALDYNDESISIYVVDGGSGQLRGRGHARVGARPVDGVAAGEGRFVYVLNRGSASVSAFARDGATGDLTEIAGSPYASGAPADGAMRITLHPDGRFLYVTNGPANNVAGFRIDDASGALTAIAGSPFASGSNPYRLAIDGRGAYAYAANRDSGDIYTYRIDASTGALTEVQGGRISTGTGSGPTVVTLHATQALQPSPFSVSTDPSGRYVYAASATGNVHYSFTMDPTSGALTPLAYGYRTLGRDQPISIIAYSSQSAPQAPTFRSRAAFAANAGADTISSFAVNPATGTLAAAGAVAAAGAGPRAVAVHPRSRFVLSVNETGNNHIASHQIATHGATLAPAHSTLPTAGSAPIALAVSPNGRAVYLAHRLDPSQTPDLIAAYKVNAVTGVLTPIDNGDFNGHPTFTPAVAIAVAPNGRYLYFANSTHLGWATIKDSSGGYTGNGGNAAFGAAGKTALAIHPSGRFAYVAIGTDPGAVEVYPIHAHTGAFSTTGSTTAPAGSAPRGIAIEPTGRFLYVANAGSANLSMYAVDQDTGALTSIDAPVGAGADPVALVADYGGRYVYVLSRGAQQVLTYAIDPSTGVLAQIASAPAPTGAMPSSLAVATDVE